jgi:tetratricopeptide (TPR) repeat protein
VGWLAEAYFNRGYAYDDLGQYEQAINDYDTAIELDFRPAVVYPLGQRSFPQSLSFYLYSFHSPLWKHSELSFM